MRNLVCVSILLAAALFGSSLAKAESRLSTKADEKALEWCLSLFPEEEQPWLVGVKPPPRPAKLQSFDLTNAIKPPNLIPTTEVIGKLPTLIAKYRGFWTWPTVDGSPPVMAFVERLTKTEMTLASAVRRGADRDTADHDLERMTLHWTGTHFSFSRNTAEETRRVDVFVSPSGEAMLMVSAYSRLVRLERIEGTSEEPEMVPFEATPWCLISERHLGP